MIQPALMLAVGFVSPALLGALALVALPVLIHLLSRRRFELIEWGAMRFLLQAERENRRRVRFEQWLLVLLRCTAMLLLVLLVARPFVSPGLAASLLGGRDQLGRIIVIDDSASLRFKSGAASDFDTARDSARRLLNWLYEGAAGAPITIYLTSAPAAPLVDNAELSAAEVSVLSSRIEKLEPTYQRAAPREVLAKIAEELQRDGARADIYVISDFQRTDWTADGGAGRGETGASVFGPLQELDADSARVVLLSVGREARDNIAVTAVRPQRPKTIAGMPALLDVTVANYTALAIDGLNIQSELDGAATPPVAVEEIAPYESRTLAIEAAFPDEGRFALTVRTDAADGLLDDDAFSVALPITDALDVLLVDGAPDASPALDEVYFARSALSPTGPFSSGVRVSVLDPDEVETAVLDAYDCVLLCNVPPLGEGAVSALGRYVRAGGGLAFTLGDQVGDPVEFNRACRDGSTELLPLPLKEFHASNADDEAVGVVRVGEHPVTAMFPAGDAMLSEQVRFRAFYRCVEAPDSASSAEPRPPSTSVVAARFTDDARSPALIERALGRGRVLLFTSTIDLDWNDWARATDGSYVVALLELVQHISRRDDQRLAFTVGENTLVTLSPDRYEPDALFRFPVERDRPAVEGAARQAEASVGEPVVIDGPTADVPGTYSVELKRRDGSGEVRPLCVNLDPRESDLRAAGRGELDAALGGLPHEIMQASDAFPADGEPTRYELWPAILTALIIVLMLEQLLAWWFGNPAHSSGGRRRFTAPRSFVGGAR